MHTNGIINLFAIVLRAELCSVSYCKLKMP